VRGHPRSERSTSPTNVSTYDATIAAVALANGLPLYTCNPRDFWGIDGLDVVPVAIAGRRGDHGRTLTRRPTGP
jgi:predicted nucleic acid-binding protein